MSSKVAIDPAYYHLEDLETISDSPLQKKPSNSHNLPNPSPSPPLPLDNHSNKSPYKPSVSNSLVSFENLSPNRGKKGKNISWSGVNFIVKDKVKVLSDCWGEVQTGQVCAIMGPSGAGKSSLLNVLAGRSSSSGEIHIEGKIKVGGSIINPIAYRKNIAYVMQDDSLMATATPREALYFSANLRLPSSTTREELESRVEKLLSYLGLMDCADVIIGGPLIKGISGGQKKRTSVGVEIITDPTVSLIPFPLI